MKAINRNELQDCLIMFDTGFSRVKDPNQHGWKKRIHLYDNFDSGQWLILKVEKEFIKVESGFLLKREEKNKKWPFKDYEEKEQLCEDVAHWTLNYKKSFEIKRKPRSSKGRINHS